MHLIRTRLTTRLAALTATALLAASTAVAMQATTHAKPIPPERLAQLTGTWRQIIELRRQAEMTDDETRIEPNQNAAHALESELRSQPEGELTIEIVKPDAKLLVMTPAAESVIDNLNEYLLKTLEVRQLQVEVSVDEILGTLSLRGSRWEVEEAMNIARDLNTVFVQRIEEIRKAEFEQINDRRLDTERLEQERRRADEETLRSQTVNIAWDGGNLGGLIAAVKGQVACNVVLSDPSLGEVSIPPFSVKLMAPEVLFQMLTSLPGPAAAQMSVFVVTKASIDPSSTRTVKSDGSMSAIMISRNALADGSSKHEVFDVRDWGKPDETSRHVDAIGFAMEAAGFADKVKVRLHAPSNLLFVQGPQDAVNLARSVIEATKAK